MPRKKASLLNDLSTADLKRLLAARERIDVLESERAKLAKELARVEKELGKLMDGASGPVKKTRKKKVAKKPAKKIAKKVVKKAAKKTGKKTGKKTVSKKTSGRKSSSGKMKLEDVILAVIKKNRGPVAFQDLKTSIVKGKLFKTKSGNFDNVLRRTLSTSTMVKRVGRGIYDMA